MSTASKVTAPARTSQLAHFAIDASPGGQAREAALAPIVDTVGVMLAGRRSQAGQLLLGHAAAGPRDDERGCWVPGLARGVPAETAALANASLGHALDYDDTYPGAGHPSSLLLATVLAATGASPGGHPGEHLVESFVVGFEVMARFAEALGVSHYYRGWHVTCTSGTFGAAAAAARAIGLDPSQTRTALGIAGSLAGGMQRNFGTTTKPIHSGLAARNGILAATLAGTGASADTAILDGERGFFDLYGQGRSTPEVLDQLGSPYTLVSPGTALKKYPCCFIATRPVDALLRLCREHQLSAADVVQVVCEVPLRALHAMIYPAPATGLEAKFSMEYILAAALHDGEITLHSFTDEAVARPRVRALMQQVVAREDPRLRPEDPQAQVSGPAKGGWVEVTLRTSDGREFTAAEHEPHGGPRNPFTWPDTQNKFLSCASFGGYPEPAATTLLHALADLRSCEDVRVPLRDFALATAAYTTDRDERPEEDR